MSKPRKKQMALKERLRRQLVQARQMSERLLADFETSQQWTYQIHDDCNHALWFAGHMAHTDNFFLSMIDSSAAVELPTIYQRQFGMGSQPTNVPEDYPSPSDVLEVMRERRATLLEVLDSLDDEDFTKSTPDGAPDFLSDIAAVFEMAIWHEGLHSGQLSSVRRALGHKPILPGPPVESQP